MAPSEQQDILVRARQGDADAFAALLDGSRHRAWRLAYRMTGSYGDADDVLQEALIRAFEGIRGFRGRSRFDTWFTRIVLNVASSLSRATARRPRADGFAAAERVGTSEAGQDPLLLAEASELQEALQAALLRLPTEQRAAFVLVAFEGLSYAEAAETLQCPDGTLAWWVAEARRKLAETMAPYLD